VSGVAPSVEDIKVIHSLHHFGVDRTVFAVNKVYGAVNEDEVARVVSESDRCPSIDPTAVRWAKGELGVAKNWHHLSCDITHYGGETISHALIADCKNNYSIRKRITIFTNKNE